MGEVGVGVQDQLLIVLIHNWLIQIWPSAILKSVVSHVCLFSEGGGKRGKKYPDSVTLHLNSVGNCSLYGLPIMPKVTMHPSLPGQCQILHVVPVSPLVSLLSKN